MKHRGDDARDDGDEREVNEQQTAIFFISTLIYNVFFHPLRHIPGPLFARASGIPYAIHMGDVTIITWVKQQHEIYGAAIRLAPKEISFISGETAWPDIYGFRTGKYKNTGFYDKDRS